MKTLQILKENAYIYRGLPLTEQRSVRLWEHTGILLNEANLTTDQVTQLFQQIEQGATAAGGNRTLIGQGKDAASAVNKAWEDLKTKIQNSGPVQNFDQKMSDILSKIGMGAAEPQFKGQVNSWVQKYRDFAQKHPIAQGAIYATLIALAGISGAGLAGAATLGLLKMADQLIQGKRFSSAAYQGAKTGAIAYGASKLGDYIKGDKHEFGTRPGENEFVGKSPEELDRMMGGTQSYTGQGAPSGNYSHTVSSGSIRATGDSAINNSPLSWNQAMEKAARYGAKGPAQEHLARSFMKGATARAANESVHRKNIKYNLTESQIRIILIRSARYQKQLNEGIWDSIKSAAGKAMDWAKTKGHNLTTKVTADKLMQAWQKAGKPTDSSQVSTVLRGAGVTPEVIDQVYSSMGIAGTPGAATGTTARTHTGGKVPGQLSQTPNAIRKRQQRAAAPAAPAPAPAAPAPAPAAPAPAPAAPAPAPAAPAPAPAQKPKPMPKPANPPVDDVRENWDPLTREYERMLDRLLTEGSFENPVDDYGPVCDILDKNDIEYELHNGKYYLYSDEEIGRAKDLLAAAHIPAPKFGIKKYEPTDFGTTGSDSEFRVIEDLRKLAGLK